MKKRHVIVTGGSKGIGLATANLLLQKGHTVHTIARTVTDHGDATGAQLSGNNREYADRLHEHGVDLLDEQACDAAIDNILAGCQPDALVCNAGSGRFGTLEQYSSQQIQSELQLNLLSHILISRKLLPHLKQQQRSDIVFTGSESALQGGRFGSIYSAAKFGLRGFAQALRYECAASNCHIGIVNPGMVRTEFFDNLNFEPGSHSDNALQPDDVAQAVIQILSSPDHAVIEEININPLKKVVQKKNKVIEPAAHITNREPILASVTLATFKFSG